MHPFAPFERQRLPQIASASAVRPERRRAPRRACSATSASSPNIRGRRSSANRVEAVVQEPLRVRRPAGAQAASSRSRATPDDCADSPRAASPAASARRRSASRGCRAGSARTARRSGCRRRYAAASSISCMPALPAAAESGDVRDPPQRQRQRRDDVAIGADDETGILALRRERRAPFSCSS